MKHFLIMSFLLLAGGAFGQPNPNSTAISAKVWDVKDFGAQGDGKSDDTEAIQATIFQAHPGDTVLVPEGTFIVKTLGLRSGIHLKSNGILKQQLEKQEEFTTAHQNSSAPLLRGKDVSDVHISIKTQSQNESIYLTGSQNITVSRSTLSGDSTKVRSFSGILLYNCENIEVVHSTIQHFGTGRLHTDSYQPGTGIRILESNDVTIDQSLIQKNGENGVFIHTSPHVEVINSTIQHNGMSGIQLAFGSQRNEKNYRFENNILQYNSGDAIDINNRGTGKPLPIHALIIQNTSKGNGFVNGKSTPDGSGIATLVNVSEVDVLENNAADNNRPAVYLDNCGEIYLTGNKADNQVEIVGNLEELTMVSNTFANVTFIQNVNAKYICLENNQFTTLHIPNGITVDSLNILRNEFENASLNINLEGAVRLKGNTIQNRGKSPAILLVKAAAFIMEDNQLQSESAQGIAIRKMANKVAILDNTISALNTCIIDDGSPDLLIKGNKLKALETGKHHQTVRSKNPKNLLLVQNEHTGKPSQPVVVLEGNGTASLDAEKIIEGEMSLGQVKVTTKNL